MGEGGGSPVWGSRSLTRAAPRPRLRPSSGGRERSPDPGGRVSLWPTREAVCWGPAQEGGLKCPPRNPELNLSALAPLAGAARPRFRGAEDARTTSGCGRPGRGDRRRPSSTLLFCRLGILALSPAESLSAGGSRDPTETPGPRLPFVSSEGMKAQRKRSCSE